MKLVSRTCLRRTVIIAIFCLSLLYEVGPVPLHARTATDAVFFPETGHSVGGPFLRYWQERGGLSSYGYPITDEIREAGLTVQYFERARFEFHPENAGTPHDVLLGRLGAQLTSTRDFAPALLPSAPPGGLYFPESRHTLRADFLDYWRMFGGLDRFGYPISEELPETSSLDHGVYTVQYFERARFELHPDYLPPYRVLLGQLGKELLDLRGKASRFVQVLDGQLVAGQDLTPFKLKGFNYFPRDFAWTDFADWPPERVNYELGRAQSLGANVLRVFISFDALGGPAAHWSKQEAFANLVRMAKAHNMYLIVSLFDGERKVPMPGWDNWPALGTPEDARDKAYLAAVITPWKDEQAILGWDLYNEPDFVTESEWQWSTHRANRVLWLSRMSVELRRLDPNHLITVGVALAGSNSLGASGGLDVLGMVDFVSVHYYTRNYGSRGLADVLRDLRSQTRKPLVVEEAGASTIGGPGEEEAQAGFLRDAMRAVKDTRASGLLVWTLYDFPAHSSNSEGYYGLFRADDTAKPAAAVFAGN